MLVAVPELRLPNALVAIPPVIPEFISRFLETRRPIRSFALRHLCPTPGISDRVLAPFDRISPWNKQLAEHVLNSLVLSDNQQILGDPNLVLTLVYNGLRVPAE